MLPHLKCAQLCDNCTKGTKLCNKALEAGYKTVHKLHGSLLHTQTLLHHNNQPPMSKKHQHILENIFPSQSEQKMGAIPECLQSMLPLHSGGKEEERQEDSKPSVCCHRAICSPFTEQEFSSFVNGAW